MVVQMPLRSRVGIPHSAHREADQPLVEKGVFANRLCEAENAIALAVENRIFVSDRFEALCRFGKEIVFAHELAHFLQKQLSRYSSAEDWVGEHSDCSETEADIFAGYCLAGKHYRCQILSDFRTPSAWGCVGHFWTVWLAYLNAQEDEKLAFKTALYCWMPDQVYELDAKHLYFTYVKRTPNRTGMQFASWGARNPWVAQQVARNNVEEREYYEMIHKGIHCLNGRNAEMETAYRKKNATSNTLPFILRAMAHHSFGDSFAHRDVDSPGKMYGVGTGHGFDSLTGDDPDSVSNAKAGKTYRSYVKALQEVACAWTGKPPLLPLESLLLALNPMLHHTCRLSTDHINSTPADLRLLAAQELVFEKCGHDEGNCAEHLKKIASRALGKPMNRIWYNPDRDPKPWRNYYMEHVAQIEADSLMSSDRETNIYSVLNLLRSEASKWSSASR
jgi:hypothetical protein